MRKIFIVIGFISSTGFAGQEGGWSGGGGDFVRILFEEARKEAANMANGIHEQSFDENISPEVKEFLVTNKSALETDLMKSKHDWEKNDPTQKTCAWTEYQEQADIRLSFDKCAHSQTREAAVMVLIHETVHHFGIRDHAFADRAAIALYRAWENKKLKELPLCTHHSNMEARSIVGRWRADSKLAKRLFAGTGVKIYRADLEITEDPTALKLFPGIGKCAYFGGRMTLKFKTKWSQTDQKEGEIRSPIAIVERKGNVVLLHEERGKDENAPISDMHPWMLKMANAVDPENNILFVGGDHGDEPTIPLIRSLK